MVVCNVRRLDQNRSMPTRQTGSLGHVGMKNPQPFLTRGLIPLYNWRCNLVMCTCEGTGPNISQFSLPYTNRQSDALRVDWFRLCQNIKKATKVFKRVDFGPTPDRHDQHENARERTSTSGLEPMLGKWGFYNWRPINERRTACQRHSEFYQSQNLGNVRTAPQRNTQETHTNRNQTFDYETISLSFAGRGRERSHHRINCQRMDWGI